MLYHNSHSESFKMPVGAIPCGRFLRLRFLCDESDIVILHTYDGEDHEFPMVRLEDHLFEAILKLPEKPMLFWYDFIIPKPKTLLYYGNSEGLLGGEGRCSDRRTDSYQVTVYDPDFQTPEYLHKGIMYQIFPDRFYRTAPPQKTKDIKKAHPEASYHKKWNEQPRLDISPEDGDNCALDFFGGSLKGICEKLDELQALGITILYLNPIFRARSNHRYDTGSYEEIDPILGNEADFQTLIQEAQKRGIRILLDGVFSHTGSDSQYFNRFGRYPTLGAWQSRQSPYFSWYSFEEFPNRYKSWWSFQTLPNLNKNSPEYREYLLKPKKGIIPHWLLAGANGWRLDVVDELPMDLVAQIRQAVKGTKTDACLYGEVWEDASNKVSYGQMRSYCLGDTLDSVMNYPLRKAIIQFLTHQTTAYDLQRTILHQREVYPAPFLYSLMNLLGSHDRARILNILAGFDPKNMPELTREEAGQIILSSEQLAMAKKRYLIALQILCALPGTPAIYYGDEIGMSGMSDPWNRAPMDWKNGDKKLKKAVSSLLYNRKQHPVLQTGFLSVEAQNEDELVIKRYCINGKDVFGNPCSDQSVSVCIHR